MYNYTVKFFGGLIRSNDIIPRGAFIAVLEDKGKVLCGTVEFYDTDEARFWERVKAYGFNVAGPRLFTLYGNALVLKA